MAGHDVMNLPVRSKDSKFLNVVVETPAGSRNKFKFDPEIGTFRIDKILPLGAAFPYDFGFVPRTSAEDGDPLDILVIADEPTYTGCILTTRLLGIIEANQTEKGKTIRNDRLIAIVETRKNKPEERSLNDLPPRLLDQIEHFFISYNRAEGREFKPLARRGPRAAAKLIEQGMRAFSKRR